MSTLVPTDAAALVTRNDPLHPQYDPASYVGTATNDARHDVDMYWRLETALVQLAEVPLSRDLLSSVYAVGERITLLNRCHFDPADVFRYVNLSDTEVSDLDHRIREVVRGVFDGKAPARDAFEAENPHWPDR